jgi:histidinol-phosphate phosphatase family protein
MASIALSAQMKAIFLDRDGVINKYPGDTKYVTSLKEFRFLPGSKKAISLLNRRGFKLFVISNQAGVGKGIYSQAALNAITKHMLKELRKAGGDIQEVYYCTHRPDEKCSCRKPRAGMIKKVKQKYRGINLKESFFIGDTIRDIHTANDAGCKSILVLSGKEKLKNRKNWEAEPDFVFKNLKKAADFVKRLK